MELSGLYSIDGNDWFDTYGFFVQKIKGKGKDAFLKFPDAKKPALSKNWPDQHGTEYDLSERFYEEKEILIDGILMADTAVEFWDKHKAMLELFGKPGTRRMYVQSLSRSFFVFYDSCTDFGTLTPLNNEFAGKIGCSYSFKFIEPVPSFWEEFSYLTDNQNNYLLTTIENKIIV
jgi:hypothetical protein